MHDMNPFYTRVSAKLLFSEKVFHIFFQNDHIRFGKNGLVISCEEIINMVKTSVQVILLGSFILK